MQSITRDPNTLVSAFFEGIPSLCAANTPTSASTHPPLPGALRHLSGLHHTTQYGLSHSLQGKGSVTLPEAPTSPNEHCSFVWLNVVFNYLWQIHWSTFWKNNGVVEVESQTSYPAMFIHCRKGSVQWIWKVILVYLISLLFNPYKYLDWSTCIIWTSETIFKFIRIPEISDVKIFRKDDMN